MMGGNIHEVSRIRNNKGERERQEKLEFSISFRKCRFTFRISRTKTT